MKWNRGQADTFRAQADSIREEPVKKGEPMSREVVSSVDVETHKLAMMLPGWSLLSQRYNPAKFLAEVREEIERLRAREIQLDTEIALLRAEIAGLRGFKRSLDEALNMGDGTYRP